MILVRLAPLLTLRLLPKLMREQRADHVVSQLDHAALAGLRLRVPEAHAQVPGLAVRARRRGLLPLLPPGLLHHLPTHRQRAPDEVDVVPAQAQRLTAPQTRVRDHLEQAAEPVAADRVEEGAQLLTGPRLDLGFRGLRERRLPGDVERDQILLGRRLQRARQRRVNPTNGRLRQLPVVDRGHHAVDVRGPEVPQAYVPHVRLEVVADVVPVGPQRGDAPALAFLEFDPLVKPHRQLHALVVRVGALADLGEQLVQRFFRVV
nr:hypothetical protein [Streptomyces mutabilis]